MNALDTVINKALSRIGS